MYIIHYVDGHILYNARVLYTLPVSYFNVYIYIYLGTKTSNILHTIIIIFLPVCNSIRAIVRQ